MVIRTKRRQGGVLSTYLFAVYISVFEKVAATRVGCHVKWACASILMYADDILVVGYCRLKLTYLSNFSLLLTLLLTL